MAENAYALGQNRHSTIGYSPGPVTSQPSYMNIGPQTTNVGIPIAVSTPVPQLGPTLYRPTPTHRVWDILEPSLSEQARAKYLERQMRHIKGICLPPSETQSS